MKKIIHVNRQVIQQNEKYGLNLPVCRVMEGSKTRYGDSVEIHGPSRMVYRPESPLKCGAKLWIETDSDISIVNEVTYKDIKSKLDCVKQK